MDKTIKVTFIVGLFVSLVFLYGFKTLSGAIKLNGSHNFTISTTGYAKKMVKSDMAEVQILITNKDEDLERLNAKRIADKQQVFDFVKTCGLDEKDIISVNMKTAHKGDAYGQLMSVNMSPKGQTFTSSDTVVIHSKNLESVAKIKDQMIQLSSKGLVVSCECSYKLLDLESVKAELLKEAVKNAEKDANELLAPFHKKVKKVLKINSSSDFTVKNELDVSNSIWSSSGESTIMKKVKHEVSATFSYE